jgi:hypothetical protein
MYLVVFYVGEYVWVCGCVGVWLCGCVVVWVCGCVGVYTKSKTSELSPLRRKLLRFAFLLRCVRINIYSYIFLKM